MKPIYTFHSDPGHAWLEVPLGDALNVPGISPYSYIDVVNRKAYLEEDCDATRFLAHWHGAHWREEVNIQEKYEENTFIRNLPRYGKHP